MEEFSKLQLPLDFFQKQRQGPFKPKGKEQLSLPWGGDLGTVKDRSEGKTDKEASDLRPGRALLGEANSVGIIAHGLLTSWGAG